MQRDEIIEMAKEAGFWQDLSVYEGLGEHFKAFANLVADKTRKELREEIIYTWVPPHFVDLAVKEEREACAKVCNASDLIDFPTRVEDAAISKCAKAIRARGEA